MTVLVAVFRRPEMLKALLCERHNNADGTTAYLERIVALSAVPEEMCPWGDADIRAWRSLQKVPMMSARATKAIVRSLLSTVVDPEYSPPEARELRFDTGAVDLRPMLCGPLGEQRVLSEQGDAIACHRVSSELPDWHWSMREEIGALPPGFRRHFLWGLSLAPWEHVELMLAVYNALQLAEDSEFSFALARMAIVGKRETILWWCDVFADVEAQWRVRAVQLVLEAGAQGARPDATVRDALVRCDEAAATTALAKLVP